MIDSKLFLEQQLEEWQEAQKRYQALSTIQSREIKIDQNVNYRITFNPLRAKSTNAKIDAKSIAERPCFLCKKNRPTVQKSIQLFDAFDFLVNPFPVDKEHFTIVHKSHIAQNINTTFSHFIALAKENPQLTFFYNGAKCGASAPDHMHFQAVTKGFLPLTQNWRERIVEKRKISTYLSIYQQNLGYPLLTIESQSKAQLQNIFEKIYKKLSTNNEEPNWNLLTWQEEDKIILSIILRKKHRPQCFEEKKLIISPASIDLSGVITTVREEDFKKVNTRDIQQILSEVCFTCDEFKTVWNKIKTIENNWV